MAEDILSEARRLIEGDREKTYGKPDDNFKRIAAIWTAILGVEVTVDQVSLCMIGLKLARLANQPTHRDSLVDLCGYAALLHKVQNLSAKHTEVCPKCKGPMERYESFGETLCRTCDITGEV